MRSKQNKLKRKVSRRQKAGKPLKDLEKSVKDALSKLSVIETVLKSKNSHPKVWNLESVQKSKDAEDYLNDVATTLRSVLREINGNGLSSMSLAHAQPSMSADTLRSIFKTHPDLFEQLLSDPEKRSMLLEILGE